MTNLLDACQTTPREIFPRAVGISLQNAADSIKFKGHGRIATVESRNSNAIFPRDNSCCWIASFICSILYLLISSIFRGMSNTCVLGWSLYSKFHFVHRNQQKLRTICRYIVSTERMNDSFSLISFNVFLFLSATCLIMIVIILLNVLSP